MSPTWCLLSVVFLTLLIPFLTLSQGAEKIEVEPPMDLIIPLGTPVTFKCIRKIPGALLGWRVYLSNGELLFGTSAQNNLASLGIELLYPNENSSILHFNGTDDRLVAVDCRFIDLSTGDTVASNRTNIVLFGPPQSPNNITVTRSGELLAINWTVPAIPFVAINFTVILKIPEAMRVEINNTYSHQFTVPVVACKPFEVEIVASNLAGSNRASVIGILPRLPQDLCHELSMKDGGIFLTVTLTVSKCLMDEEASFELEVRNINGHSNITYINSRTSCSSNSAGDRLFCQNELLQSNSNFNFVIVSSNSFGKTLSDPVMISSYSVQGVTVSSGEAINTYFITCSFLAESDIHGCSYILTDADNTISVSGIVIRNNENTGRTQVVIQDIQNYSSIVAYELDSNNGTIYTMYPFTSSNIFEQSVKQTCVVASWKASTEDITTPTYQSNIAVIIASIIGIVAVLLILVLVILVLCFCGIKHKLAAQKIQSHMQDAKLNTDSIIINASIKNQKMSMKLRERLNTPDCTNESDCSHNPSYGIVDLSRSNMSQIEAINSSTNKVYDVICSS